MAEEEQPVDKGEGALRQEHLDQLETQEDAETKVNELLSVTTVQDPENKQKPEDDASSFPAESSVYSKAVTNQSLVIKLEKQLMSEREAK